MSDLSSFLSTRNKEWSAKLWDGFIEAVQARLAPLEEQLDIQKEVTDAIIARGLTVIEQELAPIVAQADQILDDSTAAITAKLARFEQKVTGGTVICASNSSATLVNGATINLTVIAADREFFAPTPFLALSRTTTTANWAIAKVNSFNRSTGALSLTLEQVTGAGGPYTDWIITSLPGATLLQKAYYEQTLALREQVGSDRVATGEDRAATLAHRTAAEGAAGVSVAARNGSEAAYANVRKAIAEPLIPPTDPVVGQIWWDGSITRVYDGVGFVPTVTTSIGGRRFEQGTFGPSPDGVITVGGGFTAALVFLNGSLLREGEDYTADSPEIVILTPQEGDEYFVEAYLATDVTDYYTKEQVDGKVSTSVTTARVGAAIAAANGKETPADGDFFAGVEAGGSTTFKTTWGNIKAAFTAIVNSIVGGNMAGRAYPRRADGQAINFNGSGVAAGNPPALVGGGWDGNFNNFYFYTTTSLTVGWANGATYADRLGPGGWTLATIQDQLNWRVTDTRYAGYIEHGFDMSRASWPAEVPGGNGYVVTGIWTWSPKNLGVSFRQPQIHIPNVGWRALGSW